MKEEERICGLHPVLSDLRNATTSVREIWLQQGRADERVKNLLALARNHGIEVKRVPREVLDKLAPAMRHQGVVARVVASALAGENLETLLERHQQDLFLLVLDGVQDPHNLGACLRTADAAGVHGVVAPKDRAVAVNATVRKVACGAAEVVPFFAVTNLARTLRQLRAAGVWIVGTGDQAEATLYESDLRGPLALVLGAEGKGLRRLTQEHCDNLVRIPMAGSVASLNVSVAAGICLFEAVRQRDL